MFELKGVSKIYGRTVALQPTDLVVPTGRTTVLIGPSGCGKSTVLRLMIGLLRPDTGAVYFEGSELTAANVLELRHRMGYVIQDGGLFPHLTARDNAALLARHLGWDERRVRVRVDDLAELAQLPHETLDRYPAQLSGGQRQRVALIRALMLNPDVLLMDEPLGALDPLIRADLQEDLRHVFQTLSTTVVLVTHDLGEAGFFGDTLVLLRDGQIVQQGPLGALVASPADPFVTRFINAQRSPLAALEGGVS